MKITPLLALLATSLISPALSQTRENFTLNGLSAFVITPPNPAPGNPWIAYAPAVGSLPNWTGNGEEKWMFDQYFAAGIAVAGIYSGDLSGNPTQRAGYTELYNELVSNRGFAEKFSFHVRSRGGLLGYNWAADNPGKVAAIGGIYPVTNLLSYPGQTIAASHYQITTQELTTNSQQYNPIERLTPLFNSGVKIFHIHGDNDGTVPLAQNSQITKDRYDALGGDMTLKVIIGGGHDLNNHWWNDQELTDFMISETLSATNTPSSINLLSTTPSDNSLDIETSTNLVAQFNTPITLTGNGSIILKNLSGGPDIPINLTTDVLINANSLTINPPVNLAAGQEYAVEISNDAIQNTQSPPSNFPGLQASDDPNWSFTTRSNQTTLDVVNPSFEADDIPNGTFQNGVAQGWTTVGTVTGTQDFNDNQSPQPTEGEQHAAISFENQTLSQLTPHTIEAGRTYSLTADIGQVTNFTGSQATIWLFGSNEEITTPLNNSNGTAQLSEISPTRGTYLLNQTITYTTLDENDPFLGQQIGIAFTNSAGTQVLVDNVRLSTNIPNSQNTFATWVSNFNLGANNGPNDDPDGDGLDNRVEAWLGTNPSQPNVGITTQSSDGLTFELSHNQNPNTPSDLNATYQWSPNLTDWFSDGSGPPNGPIVTLSSDTSQPPTNFITLQSTEFLPKIFFRIIVNTTP